MEKLQDCRVAVNSATPSVQIIGQSIDKYDLYSELMLGIFLTARKFWGTFLLRKRDLVANLAIYVRVFPGSLRTHPAMFTGYPALYSSGAV